LRFVPVDASTTPIVLPAPKSVASK